MRDLVNNISPVLTIGPSTFSAAQTGATVDLLGFDAATIAILAGVGGISFSGTNKVEVVAEHSDDGSTWTPLTQADVIGATVTGSGIVKSFVAAHAAAAVYEVGYIGGRRRVRASLDFSGTHGTGTPFAVMVLRGLPASMPA